MNPKKLLDAIGNIDEALIDEASSETVAFGKSRSIGRYFALGGSLAACMAVIALVFSPYWPKPESPIATESLGAQNSLMPPASEPAAPAQIKNEGGYTFEELESLVYDEAEPFEHQFNFASALEIELVSENLNITRGGDQLIIKYDQWIDDEFALKNDNGVIELKRNPEKRFYKTASDYRINGWLDAILRKRGVSSRSVDITIPESMSLDCINIDTGSGLTVESGDRSTKTISSTVTFKSYTLGGNVSINGSGQANIRDSQLDKISINIGNGKVDIRNSEFTSPASVDIGNGEIRIQNCTFAGSMSGNVGNGVINISDCNLGGGAIAGVGNGEISVDHCTFSNLEASIGNGNGFMTLSGDTSDYDIAASGKFTYNGEIVSRDRMRNESASSRITLTTSGYGTSFHLTGPEMSNSATPMPTSTPVPSVPATPNPPITESQKPQSNNVFPPNSYERNNAYYVDRFVFLLKQTNNVNPNRYAYHETLEVGGKSYILAYSNEAYYSNHALRKVASQKVAELVTGADEMFVVLDAEGPFSETPDELCDMFYTDRNIAFFAAMIPYASDGMADQYAETAYHFSNTSMFAILINHAGQQKIDELFAKAVENGKTSFVSLLINHFSGNIEQYAEAAYNSSNTSMFAVLMNHVSQQKIDELFVKAVESGKTSFVSLLVNHFSGNIEQYAEAAYNNSNTGMFAVLMNHISQQKIDELYIIAVESGKTSFVSLLVNHFSGS